MKSKRPAKKMAAFRLQPWIIRQLKRVKGSQGVAIERALIAYFGWTPPKDKQ